MEPCALPAHATVRILEALAAEGLDPSYAAFVARHLTVPDTAWRWCCGSNCDPCVQRLGRAVDTARLALGTNPEGIPPADRSA